MASGGNGVLGCGVAVGFRIGDCGPRREKRVRGWRGRVRILGDETFQRTIPNTFARNFNHETDEICEIHEREPGITRTIHGFTLHRSFEWRMSSDESGLAASSRGFVAGHSGWSESEAVLTPHSPARRAAPHQRPDVAARHCYHLHHSDTASSIIKELDIFKHSSRKSPNLR